MEIRPYSNQDKPLLDVFEILPEDRKFTRTPIQNIDLAKGDDERHPTLVMRDNQCGASLLYMKVRVLNHIVTIIKLYFSVHLVWMHDIVVKVLEKQ